MIKQKLNKIAMVSLMTLAAGSLGCDQAELDELEAADGFDDGFDESSPALGETDPDLISKGENEPRFGPSIPSITAPPPPPPDCDPWFEDCATSCLIETSGGCPNYPAMVFPHYDDWNGSATSTVACMARASDYGNWCGAGNDQYFKATSTLEWWGGTMFLGSEYWARNGCLVKIGDCPHYPSMANRTIMDTWNNANNNMTVCLARAMDYVLWCAPPGTGNKASAAYYVNQVRVIQKAAVNL